VSVPKDNAIEIVESREFDSPEMSIAVLSDVSTAINTAIASFHESDVLESRVDSLADPSSATLDTNLELDEASGLEKSDNMIVVGQWSNKTLDTLVIKGAEVDLIAFDYEKSVKVDGVEMFRVGDSIEAVTLSIPRPVNIPLFFHNRGG
jgi:hypothetical protein